MFEVQNLYVSVDKKEVVHGLNFALHPGEVRVIMGPNGSGKSTLANALAGHPKYTVTEGKILLDGEDLTTASAEQRAKAGLFLSMQYTPDIPGVTIANFLRVAYNAKHGSTVNPLQFHKILVEKVKELQLEESILSRYLNVGFSGGEKKRLEMLQLVVLEPSYAILDETDSGLDVDALKVVAASVNQFHSQGKGVLLITHYNRLLEYIVPDVVHVMVSGTLVASGDKELARDIEQHGYARYA